MTPKQIKLLKELLQAGGMCSNVCYNLARREYTPDDDHRSMMRAYTAWDKASRAIRKLIK